MFQPYRIIFGYKTLDVNNVLQIFFLNMNQSYRSPRYYFADSSLDSKS